MTAFWRLWLRQQHDCSGLQLANRRDLVGNSEIDARGEELMPGSYQILLHGEPADS